MALGTVSEGNICRCPNPTWVSGVCYVDAFDVASLHAELAGSGREIECEHCGGVYHPLHSADPYAF